MRHTVVSRRVPPLPFAPPNIGAELVAKEVDLRNRAGGRVAALLPVHYGGHPCDMQTLLEVAATFDLALVEDAAHALPAWSQGGMVGDITHPTVRRAVAF